MHLKKKTTKKNTPLPLHHTSLSRPKALLKPFWEMNRSKCINIERVTWSIGFAACSWAAWKFPSRIYNGKHIDGMLVHILFLIYQTKRELMTPPMASSNSLLPFWIFLAHLYFLQKHQTPSKHQLKMAINMSACSTRKVPKGLLIPSKPICAIGSLSTPYIGDCHLTFNDGNPCNGYYLGCPPSQDASGKWRFIGIPY